MRILPLITTLSLCASIACNPKTGSAQNNEQETRSSIKINLDKTDAVSFKDLFSQIELIPLETNEQSLVKHIGNIETVGNRLYIIDPSQQTLFVFNEKGKFLFKIADRGQGPAEYNHIADFIINESTNTIELLAPINRAIYQYDMDGNFLQKLPLPAINGAYMNMHQLNSDTLVFWTPDREEGPLKYYSYKEKKIILQSFSGERKDNQNGKYFFGSNQLGRYVTNEVYTLTEKGPVIAYEWDFTPYSNENKQIEYPSGPTDMQKFINSIFNSEVVDYVFDKHLRNETYYYARVVRKGKLLHIFHNTKENRPILFEKFKEKLNFYPFLMTDKFMIGTQGHYELTEIIHPSLLSEEEKQKLERHIEDNNPILIKYHF